MYCGCRRGQNTFLKISHHKQEIPSNRSDNKNDKSWIDCVNIDDLLKYLFIMHRWTSERTRIIEYLSFGS